MLCLCATTDCPTATCQHAVMIDGDVYVLPLCQMTASNLTDYVVSAAAQAKVASTAGLFKLIADRHSKHHHGNGSETALSYGTARRRKCILTIEAVPMPS